MNLRFPEIFGFVLFVAILCSFGLPRSRSGPIENTFQFLFAPVTGPIQWMTSNASDQPRRDEPILTHITDEQTRLRAEKLALEDYVAVLRGQIETLRHRQAEAERVGVALRDRVRAVKVIGVDGNGRDVLRLASAPQDAPIAEDTAVVSESGIVGKVLHAGAAGQSSVRLITDRGFKVVGNFGRFEAVADDRIELRTLPVDAVVLEGMGNGVLRIDSLTMEIVRRAGLKVGDLVFLADTSSTWPIELHGFRLGAISYLAEKIDAPGVAEVRVRPEKNLLTLKEVMVIVTAEPQKPA